MGCFYVGGYVGDVFFFNWRFLIIMIIAPFEIVKVPHQSFKSRLDTRVNVFQFTGAGFHCWAFAGEGVQFLLLRVNSPLLRHSLVPLAASKTHFGVFFFSVPR